MRTQPQDIIQKLEHTNSRLEKEQILEDALREGCDEFFSGVQLCLDKLITFGVKQVPFKEGTGQGLSWAAFEKLAQQLRHRELTGHAARDAIDLAIDIATEEQWNGFYRRILIKDLRAGVSDKTVNKVCKKMNRQDLAVSVFSCQLAHDGAKHEKKIRGRKLIEGKLDGSRLLITVHPHGEVECFSRNGKLVENFREIARQFSDYAVSVGITKALVFDGEIMSESFQDLMKQMYRKTDVETDDAVFHVFDVVTLDEFKSGISRTTQEKRSEHLKNMIEPAQSAGMLHNVHVVGYEEVDLDSTVGRERFEQLNRDAIEQGLEGIMIKDPLAAYECKRSHSWLKIKPVISVDLEVTAVEEGTGRNLGKLGALVCSGVDDGRRIQVNVGSGFSDEQRELFWKHRAECIGMVVEALADAVTQNADGTYSLRFPRFKTFRGFTPGEKI